MKYVRNFVMTATLGAHLIEFAASHTMACVD